MTSTAFAPSLSLPPMDDTMEMSSPARHNDGDIDIDFDDYGAVAQLTDDERMLEDGEPARPGTATDDMMADDDDSFDVISAPVVEAEMQDDHPYQHHDGDEELIDYDDAELLEHGIVPQPEVPVPDTIPAPEALEEQAATDEAPVEQASSAAAEVERAVDAADATGSAADHQSTSEEAHKDGVDPDQVDAPLQWNEADLEVALADAAENGDEPAQKAPPQMPGSLDTSTLSFTVDGPPTPTDTGLHPMIIQFADHEWPLFKSRAQPDGLLKDDNLVNVSLAELLSCCKQRLNQRLAEVVTADQDLVIGFDRIGLMLMECSSHASAVSLNDILELYVILYQNDEVEDIPPLSMTLTTQLKFTSHLEMLKHAAATGTGISTYVSANRHQHADDDCDDEGQGYEEGTQEQEYQAEDLHEQSNNEDYGNIQEAIEAGEEHNADGQEYEQAEDGDDQESRFDAYDEGNYDYDESASPGQYDEQADQDDGADTAYVGETAPEAAAIESQDPVRPDSNATCATVYADAAKDVAESHKDGGNNEVPALATASDEEQETQQEAPTADSKLETATVAEATGEQEPHVDDTVREEGGYTFDPEDFLNEDFTEYSQDDIEGQADGTAPGEGDFADLVQTDDQHQDHDTTKADKLEHYPESDLQPGEEDEQFHTAFDLLDGTDCADADENSPQNALAGETNGVIPDEDDIGFNDDDESAAAIETKSPRGSLCGKRSFDERVDDDELNFDEPESKKPRPG